MSISFTKLGKFSVIIFFQTVSNFLLFLFSYQYPHDASVGKLEVVPEAPYTILLFLDTFFQFFFSSCYSDWVFFAFLYFKLLIWFLALSTLLLIPCKLFFISISVSFITSWLFFMDYMPFFMLL